MSLHFRSCHTLFFRHDIRDEVEGLLFRHRIDIADLVLVANTIQFVSNVYQLGAKCRRDELYAIIYNNQCKYSFQDKQDSMRT